MMAKVPFGRGTLTWARAAYITFYLFDTIFNEFNLTVKI